MTYPLISVIIPARNNEKTIGRAIESIISQTYKNLEVIVVNDFSTDKTFFIVSEYVKKNPRVKLVKADFDDPNRFDAKLGRNINAGYSARNTGFKHVQGELVTFQDADDTSLRNRIEIQYDLLKKYNADHVTLDWFQLDEKFLGKKLDIERYMKEKRDEMIGPQELYDLSQKTKGNRLIPFHVRRMWILNKLFFGSLAPYPGTGNSPLFKREVIEKVQFRKLSDRVWPSYMGRGADRDFNFQVTETFKNSFVFRIPVYMWNQKAENPKYAGMVEKYILKE